MDTDLIRRFPEISQVGEIREDVDYEFVEGRNEYAIKKGPAYEVAIISTTDTIYEEGTDYDLILDNNGNIKSIDWGIGGDSPSNGEIFTVNQTFESVLSRFLSVHDEQFDELETDYNKITSIRQVDNASKRELDRIGRIFGALGRRAGRDDEDYKIFLKSIVQSFSGRGSVSGVRFAAAAGLGVTIDKIDIIEDFQNLEYDIVVSDWPKHRTSVVAELTDLADASVVNLNTIRYLTEYDETSVNDRVLISESIINTEDISTNDDNTVVTGASNDAEWGVSSWGFAEWS